MSSLLWIHSAITLNCLSYGTYLYSLQRLMCNTIIQNLQCSFNTWAIIMILENIKSNIVSLFLFKLTFLLCVKKLFDSVVQSSRLYRWEKYLQRFPWIIDILPFCNQLLAGLLVNRSSNQSCTWGMNHNKIHLIRPGCPRPSIALQCRIVA